MGRIEIAKILHKEKRVIEEKTGYKVAYIAVYGSQNYGLDIYTEDYSSDVDTKAIIVPTLDDIIRNRKPISTTIKMTNGDCDIKDIRQYVEILAKVNPAYIETLYTDMCVFDAEYKNSLLNIISQRDKLVSSLPISFCKAIYGMMKEKEKALCHPYPTIAHKIEKVGYDGKQAHHILRLWLMMYDYFSQHKPLSECFYPNCEYWDILMGLKLSEFSLSEVKDYVAGIMDNAQRLRDAVILDVNYCDNFYVKWDMMNESYSIIRQKIKCDCMEGKYD